MTEIEPMKVILKNSLQFSRDALMWKLEGVSERDLRLPRTPTGMNLLGIVKHMANVEIGYFGPTFGKQWPVPSEVINDEQFETDPQADWFATENETAEELIGLYERVWVFADETIDSLRLDASGQVPHWSEPKNAVTLQQIMVHVLVDLTRHVGHADILREGIDGQVGLRASNTNMPTDQDWSGYIGKLTVLAENTRR